MVELFDVLWAYVKCRLNISGLRIVTDLLGATSDELPSTLGKPLPHGVKPLTDTQTEGKGSKETNTIPSLFPTSKPWDERMLVFVIERRVCWVVLSSREKDSGPSTKKVQRSRRPRTGSRNLDRGFRSVLNSHRGPRLRLGCRKTLLDVGK